MEPMPSKPDSQDSTHRNPQPSPNETPGPVPQEPANSISDQATRRRQPQSDLRPRPGSEALPAGLVSHPRYEVLGLLGSGGMGTVYRARHRLMARDVALKIIRADLMEESVMVARFRREVQAAARLNHPNIVHAYDAEEAGGSHFLVMEYVEGVSLDKVLAERGSLPIGEACDHVRQAALGLNHAYLRGMVHRDIKPHNLMLTPQRQIKILDFGLARFVSESVLADSGAGTGLPPPNTSDVAMTPANAVLGSADYMAPEEAEDARRADVRADIYSLGCTLYHLLSGRVPFPGGTYLDKIGRHRKRAPVPVSEFRADMPPGLGYVLARMMAKAPEQRFQTPDAVAGALAPFAASRPRQVLVVDDNPAARRGLSAILESEGYWVREAANGQEALDRLREGPKPGLILLDLAMPVMDGAQFLRELRGDPLLRSIPVVIVSATDPVEARTAALGAAEYLHKPVEIDLLTGKVHRLTEPS